MKLAPVEAGLWVVSDAASTAARRSARAVIRVRKCILMLCGILVFVYSSVEYWTTTLGLLKKAWRDSSIRE